MPNITFGRWNPTEVMERRLDNDWPSPTPYATNLVTPTSISSTGTGNSSSIGANGSVTFSSCATLSLNGVFTSDYDNYMVVCRHQLNSSTEVIGFRLRANGVDNSTASSYVYQAVYASSTTILAVRNTSNITYHLNSSATNRSGDSIYIYGPYLAQPTAIRNLSVYGDGSGTMQDVASTHNQSSSYDGFSIILSTNLLTGLISVYGLGV